MSEPNLPLIQSYRPKTFRERGLVAPFTTPMLSGARVRRMARAVSINGERGYLGGVERGPQKADGAAERLRDSALEIIVPNPSGGRGVYILPWSDIGALCRPTMHDAMLGRSLSTPIDGIERELTPARMRDAARGVACQGLAGRAAAASAEQAIARRAEGLIATRFTLLMEITEQVENGSAAGPKLLLEAPSEIERRGRLALLHLASQLNQPPQRIADLLDMLALHYTDVGVGLGMADAAMSRLVGNLGVLRHELAVWGQSDLTSALHDSFSAARGAVAVASAAELVARMARLALETSRARLRDMPAMLRAIIADPRQVSHCCEQADWLLDGWEPAWLLWSASPSLLPRIDAVRAIIRQIPPLPDEAEVWLGLPAGTAEQLFRRVPMEQSSLTGTISHVDLVARGEQLRAMAG